MRSLKEFIESLPLPEKKLRLFCVDPVKYLKNNDFDLEDIPQVTVSISPDEARHISSVADLKAMMLSHGGGEKTQSTQVSDNAGEAILNEGSSTSESTPESAVEANVGDKIEPEATSSSSYDEALPDDAGDAEKIGKALLSRPAIFLQTGAEPFESFSPQATAESAEAVTSQIGLPFPEFRQAFDERHSQARGITALAETSKISNVAPTPTIEPLADAAIAMGLGAMSVGAMGAGISYRRIIADNQLDSETSIAEAIILADDRVQVGDTSVFPFRWLCRLEITAATGARWLGTGWFISPNVIVTAGHCVFIHNHGGWVQQIAVFVAQNGTQSFKSFQATQFATTRGWADNRERANDYGVIFTPTTDQGFFGYGVFANSLLGGALANVSGYPQDKPPGTLWGHAKKLLLPQETTLRYDIDTFGGMSGAPVVLWDGRDYVAVGIHNYGDTQSNIATRITPEVFHNFERWKGIGSAA